MSSRTVQSVSLRPLIAAGVTGFTKRLGSANSDAAEVLVELIVGLSNYSQEGLQYAPLVFVTADLETLLETVRGADPITLGTESSAVAAARTALRNCAPLGEGRRWAVYVRLDANGAEYGIFRPEGSPLRPTSFEMLRRINRQDQYIVGLSQLRSGVVEVRSSAGEGQYFDFSGSPERAGSPASVVHELAATVTSDVADDIRTELEAFYYRLGVDILTGNHGALAAVVPADAARPQWLRDGIWLPSPVDLAPWIRRDNELATREGTQALLAYAQLIRRMTMMDGITVFGTDGTVRAYSCFLRDLQAMNPSDPLTHVVGGARRRAYELLAARLGPELVAALYRSQDGAAAFVTRAKPAANLHE